MELEPFDVGDSVRVVSPPHGIDTVMTVSKVDTSLVGGKDSLTLGWGSKTLTGAVVSGGSGSSGGATPSGGGGSGGGADYITEQGTTGVWTWRKWASGIAELWAVFGADTLAMTAQTWGDLYTASWMGVAINKSARQYPFAFVDQPAVTATPIADGANFWCATNTENDTGTSLTHAPAYQCVRASDATLKNPRISYYVVGRYKEVTA